MYGSWDVERDGQNVLSFSTIFYLFTPLKKRKFKILNKMKKSLDISFYINVQKNHDHMLHCSWDTMRDGCNSYFFIWGYFLPSYPPNDPKSKKFKKMKKKKHDLRFLVRDGREKIISFKNLRGSLNLLDIRIKSILAFKIYKLTYNWSTSNCQAEKSWLQ